MIGSIIDGKYRVTRQMGAGAMGAVYEAEHTATRRRVAVKVITTGLAGNKDLIERFKHEAMAAGAIETKHITQVLDAGVDRESGLPFMVMEFLTGNDLAHLIKKVGPLAPDLALRITAQVCLGLQRAHEAGVVHRDIKPANLFLAESDGEIVVKVLDFGIAKIQMEQAHETESAGLTRTGSLLGSPLYMSPEQARGSKHIDSRADIWSLGATLYQALCGRTPYHHITALGDLIYTICSEPAPNIQQFAPWVRPEVAAIVHGCLRQNTNERFQTAKDLLAAIRQLLPQGWTIQPEMLVPMGEVSRSLNVATYALPPMASYAGTAPGGANSASASHPGSGSNPNVSSQSGIGAQGMASHPGAGSNPNVTSQSGSAVLVQSQVTAPPKSNTVLPLVFGGISVAILGFGALAFLVMRNGTTTTVPQPPPTAIAPTASVTVAPMPTLPPPIVPAPVEDKSNRRVKVAIVPPDAQVEVEGKPATISKGVIELEGKLGDVFKVLVRKGGVKKEEEVIVTKDGPSLPMISLFVTAATAKSATPAVPRGATTEF